MMQPPCSPECAPSAGASAHMVGLTRRQREALDFICAYYLECGASPSYGEIAAHLGLKSKNSTRRFVRALEARGAITCQHGKPRSLAPVRRNAITVELRADLDRAVRVLAQRAGTTPEAVVVEAVHDRLAGFAASLAPPSRRAGRRKD